MPTIFTHPAVAIGLAPWFSNLPRGLVAVAAVCTVLPDADVGAFGLGIEYGHPLGHRGFTHSLAFAALFAAFVAFAYRRLSGASVSFARAYAFIFVSMASHGLLDALTTGGRGVGFLIPFSSRRFFFPFRPIRVSPIGAEDFLEKAGVVLRSEAIWVWTPMLLIGLCGLAMRWAKRERET